MKLNEKYPNSPWRETSLEEILSRELRSGENGYRDSDRIDVLCDLVVFLMNKSKPTDGEITDLLRCIRGGYSDMQYEVVGTGDKDD